MAASALGAAGKDAANVQEAESSGVADYQAQATASSTALPAGATASTSTAIAPVDGAVASAAPAIMEGARYVADEVLIQVDESLSPDEANAFIQSLDFANFGSEPVGAEDIAHGFLKLNLVEGVTVREAMALLQGAGPVRSVEPNYRLYPAEGPGETAAATLAAAQAVSELFAQATKTDDPYVADDSLWNLEAIKAYDAWDSAKSEGKSTIAILDEGFNASHEDLAANVVDTYWAAASGSASKTDVSRLETHGTHVAGIASAEANNGKGVAGVSYNAQLMLVKIADATGGMDIDDVAKAVDYICQYSASHPEANVRVINMSIGGYSESAVPMSGVLYEAIAKARAAGIVTVCAACNAGGYYVDGRIQQVAAPFYAFPSDYDNVISVIALEKYSAGQTGVKRMSSSNYNVSGQSAKGIAAPGNNIMSTYTSPLYSTAKKGTSMAVPHVAGVLALMFAANPRLSVDDAEHILYSSATDVRYEGAGEVAGAGWDVYTGYGMANAEDAVHMAQLGNYLSGEDVVMKGQSVSYRVPAQDMWTRLSWSWTSSDESVATVRSMTASGASEDGFRDVAEVTGVGPGTATITASCGSFSVSKTITVYAEPTISGASSVRIGSTVSLDVHAGASGAWQWTSSDASVASVASVSGSGADASTAQVRGNSLGKATLTATLATNPDISATFALDVVALPFAEASVTASGSYAYTGSPVSLGVRVVDGSNALVEGRDYDLAVINSSGDSVPPASVVEEGRYTLRLTGTGIYEGVIERAFDVVKPSTGSSDGAGTSGGTGDSGDSGSSGSSGNAGASGGTGNSGSSGNAGGSGTSGDVGASGGSGGSGTNSGAGSSDSGSGANGSTGSNSGSGSSSGSGSGGASGSVDQPGGSSGSDANNSASTGSSPSSGGSGGSASSGSSGNSGTGDSGSTSGSSTSGASAGSGASSGAGSTASSSGSSGAASSGGNGSPTAPSGTGDAADAGATSGSGSGASSSAGASDSGASGSGSDLDANSGITGSSGASTEASGASAGAETTNDEPSSATAVATPTWSGASRIPVNASAAFSVKNGTIAVVSGSSNVEISGKTVVGRRAGTAKIALLDSTGKQRAAKKITVYKLSGKWKLRSAAKSKLALDVSGASKRSGANLVLWTKVAKNKRKSQQFSFGLRSDGSYTLKSANSGKLVRVVGKTKSNGAYVCQKGSSAVKAAQWRLVVDASNRVTFLNAKSGKALDVKTGKAKKNAKLIQKTRSTSKTQKWVLEKI